MFGKISEALESFGFEKIDAPLIEPVDIYLAKTSEEIVNQQIYSFIDRGDRNVAIRPEMTPTVARMVAQKIRELPRPSDGILYRIFGVMKNQAKVVCANTGR